MFKHADFLTSEFHDFFVNEVAATFETILSYVVKSFISLCLFSSSKFYRFPSIHSGGSEAFYLFIFPWWHHFPSCLWDPPFLEFKMGRGSLIDIEA